MDIYDRATEAEEKDRERSLAIARMAAGQHRDYESEICPGCSFATETNFGRACDGWADCLADLQTRDRVGK